MSAPEQKRNDEVVITQEMVKAGLDAFVFDRDFDFEEEVVCQIYLAMERARKLSELNASVETGPDPDHK